MPNKQPNYRLSGINPLAYMGVEPSTPPQLMTESFNPTINDNNFNIGTIWTTRNPAPLTIWMLVDQSNPLPGNAKWVQLYPNSGGSIEFVGNLGSASASGGILNVPGVGVMATVGSGSTLSIGLTNGSNGQVIIGGGAEAAWANITAGSGITLTTGPNSLTISASGGGGTTSFNANTGSAAPSSGVINIYGVNVVHTFASGNTIDVGLSNALNGQIPIASTGNPTAYANITSMDGTITVTNGPNTIDLSASGEVNPAAGCNFLMYQATNVSVSSPTLGDTALGEYVALTKFYDIGNNCFVGTGGGFNYGLNGATFTAPATGKYLMGASVTRSNSTCYPVPLYFLAFNVYNFQPATNGIPGGNQCSINGSTIISMTAGDTVKCFVGGGGTFGIGDTLRGSGPGAFITWWWGYRVA